MSGGRGPAPWTVRVLLRGYPREFRERFRADFLRLYAAERERWRAKRGRWGIAAFGARTLAGLCLGLMVEWWVHFRRRSAARCGRGSGRLGSTRRFEPWLLELKLVLRGLRRTPGLILAVTVTLGLGVGANTSMFELADRLLLRPPHGLREPGELHRLFQSRMTPNGRSEQSAFSLPALWDLVDAAGTVEATVGHGLSEQVVTVGDRPLPPVRIMGLTGDYWSLFELPPVLGRYFGPGDDDLPAGRDVAVVAFDFWQDVLGSDPDVVGRTLRVSDRTFTVVGVAPRGFRGLELWDASLFVPLSSLASLDHGPEFAEQWFITWLSVFVRIPPGREEVARQELTAAFRAHFARVRDPEFAVELDPRITFGPLLWHRGPFGDDSARFSLWLLGTSAVVLLVACANVATLLLGRALRRRRETAVRASLGMPTSRAPLLPVLESLVLAVLAAGVAVPLGWFLTRQISGLLLPDLVGGFEGLSPRALVFAGGVTLVAGLVSGWLAGLRIREADLGPALRAGAPGAGRPRSRLLAALPVAQTALSAVLLVGAGLFVRSLVEAATLNLGYDARRIAVVGVEGGRAFRDFARGEDRSPIRRMEALLERARSVPGVRAATLTTSVPHVARSFAEVRVGGGPEAATVGGVVGAMVDADYFRVMGTGLVRGRVLEPGEVRDGEPVAVVSESLAARLWPSGEALGACFHAGADTLPCYRVVGVAEDVRDGDLREEHPLRYYVPRGGTSQTYAGQVVLRFDGSPGRRAEAVRRELQAGLPPTVYVDVRPMERVVGEQLRQWRAGAGVLSAFGALALVVAGFGWGRERLL